MKRTKEKCCQIGNLFDFVIYLKPKLQIVTKANFHKQKGFIVAEKNETNNVFFSNYC